MIRLFIAISPADKIGTIYRIILLDYFFSFLIFNEKTNIFNMKLKEHKRLENIEMHAI